MKTTRAFALAIIAVAFVPATARAGIVDTTGANIQSGHNESDSDQDGDARAGSVVGGQSIDVRSGGNADVEATNSGENIDADVGDADASNRLSGFAGQAATEDTSVGGVSATGIDDSEGDNVQEGDNEFDYDQSADASTGDGVGGQVISVVARGDAALDATNSPEDVDVDGGDADASNDAATFVGLVATDDLTVGAAEIRDASGDNIQEGSNELDGDQSADASSGDAIGGQDLVLRAGDDAELRATNEPEHVDADSGDADSDNDAAGFVGLAVAPSVTVADLVGVSGPNIQEGDNEADVDQDADADTGPALVGQRADVSAGDDADVVVKERGRHNSASSGDADTGNDLGTLTGLVVSLGTIAVGP